jgi:hypothetical protein
VCATKRKQRKNANRLNKSQHPAPLLPALIAFGSVIATSASAVELGTATVESALGQPLRASIAYALNPNEQLMNFCIFLQQGNAANGIPALGDARISMSGNGKLLITGSKPVREPMIGFRVAVDCPNSAKLSRDYTLFVDPARSFENAPVAASQESTVQASRQASAGSVTPERGNNSVNKPARLRTASDTSAIEQGSRYLVQPGESLSTIAARVAGRPTGVWRTVNRIFAANPDAFLNNDVNRIKASVYIDIPLLSESAKEIAPTPATPVTDTVTEAEFIAAQALTADAMPFASSDATTDLMPAAVESVEIADAVGFDPSYEQDINPFVEPAPVAKAAAPAATFNDVGGELSPTGSAQDSTSWWPFAAGGLVGLFFALMLFGRRLLQYFRPTDSDADDVTLIGEAPAIFGLKATGRRASDFADSSDDNVQINFQVSGNHGEMEITEDFSFSNSFDAPLDLEFPEEDSQPEASSETDIIPPLSMHSDSILDEEVLPSEDEELNVSIALNTTVRASHDDHDADSDFEAVEETSIEDTQMTGTFSSLLDIDLLEKDYEHELTATQAANMANAKAAFDMMKKSRIDDDDATVSVRGLEEVTVEMPPQDDVTVEMPRDEEGTVEMPADDSSLENSMIAQIDTALIEELAQTVDTDNDETMQMESDLDNTAIRKKFGNG